MAKNIDKLTVTISVENAEEALVKAMDISKDKLEDWCYALDTSGWHDLADQVEEYIDVIAKVQEERNESKN